MYAILDCPLGLEKGDTCSLLRFGFWSAKRRGHVERNVEIIACAFAGYGIRVCHAKESIWNLEPSIRRC